MKKNVIIYVILTLIIFTSLQTLSYDANINVWLSDVNIAHNGKAIEFKDANGTKCEPFIYNGTVYAPVRGISEAFEKNVFWESESKTVNIEDVIPIKDIQIRIRGYELRYNYINDNGEEDKCYTIVEPITKEYDSFDSLNQNQTLTMQYFEPIPEISVEVEQPYTARVYQATPRNMKTSILIYRSGVKIAEYTINIVRNSIDEYFTTRFLSLEGYEKDLHFNDRIKYICLSWRHPGGEYDSGEYTEVIGEKNENGELKTRIEAVNYSTGKYTINLN